MPRGFGESPARLSEDDEKPGGKWQPAPGHGVNPNGAGILARR